MASERQRGSCVGLLCGCDLFVFKFRKSTTFDRTFVFVVVRVLPGATPDVGQFPTAWEGGRGGSSRLRRIRSVFRAFVFADMRRSYVCVVAASPLASKIPPPLTKLALDS